MRKCAAHFNFRLVNGCYYLLSNACYDFSEALGVISPTSIG
ncbi:hypothetical protein APHCRT_0781 [Anaplasma phagocytophilum str. CRT53-1]|uniref:Uncharacterized protein n=5 Tax=Anaplasma phagocytophilum TaxID=948 RepID=A0A0F3NB40_ANAPH|nr:hypothetical protein [Anaplasma phagocytophilum]KJV60515.1 hypothetical protein APHWEB_1364 [Anaplasma phagocytophilum str. Webster]KJV64829.1 hypothetical protein APHMUC_0332 [Anaplasma phagocytophilum str. ApMUC09]KJV65260.1 hypothetical protein EPHNCH_0964 [Anaplasma phagocytophilum str. NCH-1]KJV67143.1 hypothetical protein APHNP_0098 [Anaplasma phagocytophilum str. ApNP]KJV83369.1 hypothetical protein APHHGE2_0947 [Anaplasma phagocytophilum str. HGE2]KJV84876.1 hypothetical protein AP